MTDNNKRKQYWEFTIEHCTHETESTLNDPKILESMQYLAFWKETGKIQGFVHMRNCASKNEMLRILDCARWEPLSTTLPKNEIYAAKKLDGLLAEMGKLARQGERTDLKGSDRKKRKTIATQLDELQTEFAVSKQEASDIQTHLATSKQESNDLQKRLVISKQESSDLQTRLVASKQESNNVQTQLAMSKQESSDLQTQLVASKQESDDLRTQLETSEQTPRIIVTDIVTRMRNSFMVSINFVEDRFAHIASALKVLYMIQPPFEGASEPCIMSHDTVAIADAIKTARLQHYAGKQTTSTEITEFLDCLEHEIAKKTNGTKR